MSDQPTITDVDGVSVGHWSDPQARTGATVLVFDEPNVAAAEIRGANPGERELQTLACGMSSTGIQALLFAGGSTHGLAAADGVMSELERDGRGDLAAGFRVPLVPGVVVFDLAVGDGSVRPGPEEGAAAYRAATSAPVEMGLVGAGTGTTAGTWRGDAVPSGLGSAAVTADEATVGALAAVNPVGDVFTLEGESLTGGALIPQLHPVRELSGRENTTLVALATDARLSRSQLLRLIVRVHDALGVCIRPSHTRYDGDAAVAVSFGAIDADVDALSEAAFLATARAIEAAVRISTDHAG